MTDLENKSKIVSLSSSFQSLASILVHLSLSLFVGSIIILELSSVRPQWTWCSLSNSFLLLFTSTYVCPSFLFSPVYSFVCSFLCWLSRLLLSTRLSVRLHMHSFLLVFPFIPWFGSQFLVFFHLFAQLIFLHFSVHVFIFSLPQSFLPSITRFFIQVRSLIRSLICSFVRSFVRSFICSCVRAFLRLFMRSFVRACVFSFFRSFLCSFIRSFVRAFVS